MAAVVIAPADRSAPRRAPDPFVGRLSTPSPRPAIPGAAAAGRLDQAVYWRRRVLVLAAAVAVVGILAFAATGVVRGVASSAPAVDPARSTASSAAGLPPVYVVEPGDTLWSIAERLAPGEDPRPIVHRLARQAGGASLRPGQRLTLEGIR